MGITKPLYPVLSRVRTIRLRSPLGRKLFLDLIVYIILLTVLPALTIGYFTLERARVQAITQITDQLESIAGLKRSQLLTWLANNEVSLDVLAADSARLERFASLLTGEAAEGTDDEINRILKESVEASRSFGGLFLYDTRGRILAASDTAEVRKVVRRQPYFDASLQEAHHIESPYFDIARNQLVVVQTRAIVNRHNEIIGVLAGWLDTSALGAIMQERSGLGETGETYLVSLENNYFLTPSRFEGYVMNRAYKSEGIDRALLGQNGHGMYPGYRDTPVIGAYRWIPELRVGLVAEQEQDEALALFQETSIYIISLSFVAALIAVAAGIFIASRITRPIAHLRTLAEALSSGNLTARARVQAKNELGVLGEAFNKMAEDLSSRIEAEQSSRNTLEEIVSYYMEFIQQVSAGDLTIRLAVEADAERFAGMSDDLYRLGVNLNNMVENLSMMTAQIRETSARISAAVVQIQSAAREQIASTTEQDAAITQTMATTEQVRATVFHTSERARAVAEVSQQSIIASRQGQEAVAKTIQGMETIRQQVTDIADNILKLAERTQQIGDIIETVNAIASQSKLLALNASIEAARAGEEGRGFSVVAMEVRQLAEQSRQATKQVSNILSEIQEATNMAVMVTEEGSRGAEQGMTLVDRAGQVIRELAATLDDAFQSSTQIATSASQQINGMDQLNAAMTAIKQASLQSTRSTRQTEQSVRDLADMARQMEQAVARYKLSG